MSMAIFKVNRIKMSSRGRRARPRNSSSLWFYTVVILLATAMTAASLGPDLWPRAPTAQAGVIANGAITLGPGAMARGVDPGPLHVSHVRRGLGWDAVALRIAAKADAGAPQTGDHGVTIALAPSATDALSDRALSVEIDAAPIPFTTGDALLVRLRNGTLAEWVPQTLNGDVSGTLTFSLPPMARPSALELRVSSGNVDRARGVEIREIRLKPSSL